MHRLLFILTLVPVLVFGQYNQNDSKGKKHGIWVKKFDKSHVSRYQGQFNHGVPVDTFVYRYESGSINRIMVFSNRGKIARAKLYHETGYIMGKGKYVNQQKDSTWIYFDQRGKVSYTEQFKNGKLHGEKVVYYEKDKQTNKILPAQLLTYSDGILNGPVKEYFPGGRIKTEGTYKDDQFDGSLKKYTPDGKLASLERYSHKTKHGWQIAYNSTGKEISKKYYYHGKLLEKKAFTKKMAELKESGKNPNVW